MKKISCVGYHATGSGAVDDFLREFDNIESAKYGVECRFLQDPDGISDLEYNLIENPHRLNSGYALKKFLKFAKDENRTYHHIFGNNWLKWANSYINTLSPFKYKGYWHADIRNISTIRLFIYKVRRAVNMILPKKIRKNKYYNYFHGIETYYVDIEQEKFIKITQEYCEHLCKLLNTENKEYVVLDQLVSPQNINRYLRYINDLKVIVVDRDPRDVYLNDIIINHDFVLPKDLEEFCQIYKSSRKSKDKKENTNNVLYINFEDMVYKYEDTTKKIISFLGLDEVKHIYPKRFFDPEISQKNTRIWERKPEYEKIAQTIKEKLPEYIYEI